MGDSVSGPQDGCVLGDALYNMAPLVTTTACCTYSGVRFHVMCSYPQRTSGHANKRAMERQGCSGTCWPCLFPGLR